MAAIAGLDRIDRQILRLLQQYAQITNLDPVSYTHLGAWVIKKPGANPGFQHNRPPFFGWAAGSAAMGRLPVAVSYTHLATIIVGDDMPQPTRARCP